MYHLGERGGFFHAPVDGVERPGEPRAPAESDALPTDKKEYDIRKANHREIGEVTRYGCHSVPQNPVLKGQKNENANNKTRPILSPACYRHTVI